MLALAVKLINWKIEVAMTSYLQHNATTNVTDRVAIQSQQR